MCECPFFYLLIFPWALTLLLLILLSCLLYLIEYFIHGECCQTWFMRHQVNLMVGWRGCIYTLNCIWCPEALFFAIQSVHIFPSLYVWIRETSQSLPKSSLILQIIHAYTWNSLHRLSIRWPIAHWVWFTNDSSNPWVPGHFKPSL